MRFWKNSPARLLFTWTRWLSLRHPSVRLVNITLPIWGFLVCVGVGLLLPALNFTKGYGVIQQANGLLQILAPFFVAALALIAGFPGEALDRPMGGLQPYIIIAGEKYEPTRRELLGYLFAYLAGSSVLIYLGGGVVTAASNPTTGTALVWLGAALHGYGGVVLKASYGAILIHVFAVTLLGLNFLGNFLTSSRIVRESRPVPTPINPITPPQGPPGSREVPENRLRGAG